jgi:hypothetical protein
VTIRNGVDVSRFAAPVDRDAVRGALGLRPEHTVAAVVARLEPQKGQDVVIEVADRLSGRFPQLRWLLVGGGSAEPAFRAEVARRGLGDRVLFTGFRTDSADLLRSADLSVLVSTKEGLSNTLLESLVAGLPVVASRVGGNAEVVATGAGLLVPPRDANALAAAVELVAADPAAAARMGARGREHVRREFTVARMVEQTAALWDELLGLAGPPLRGTRRRPAGAPPGGHAMSGRRRIAFLVSEFPRPVDAYMLRELTALDARGVDLLIYSLRRPAHAAVPRAAEALRSRVVYAPRPTAGALLAAHATALRTRGRDYVGALRDAIAGHAGSPRLSPRCWRCGRRPCGSPTARAATASATSTPTGPRIPRPRPRASPA